MHFGGKIEKISFKFLFGIIIAVTPEHSAVLIILPKLCGSESLSKRTKNILLFAVFRFILFDYLYKQFYRLYKTYRMLCL